MIQKLRWKFIATNMILVGLVLLIVFAALLGTNSRQLRSQSEAAMRTALKWSEGISPPRLEIGPGSGLDTRHPGEPSDDGTENRQREFTMVPVFSMVLESDGSIRWVNLGNNIEIDEDVLESAVAELLAQGSESGILRDLNLRYQMETGPEGDIHIAFADKSWETQSMERLLLTSLVVGILGLAGFFLIALFLAQLSLRPVEQAWDRQRQFVADASHELKTPITVILANTTIVLAHPNDPVQEQSKWINYIQDEAVRMKSLVDDLLFLAKSDAARLPRNPTQVRLSELVTGSILPFESVAFESGVTLKEEVTPDLTVHGDEAQLRRLVVILLDNAVKYAGEHGTVTVTLDKLQDKPRLLVHNTGPAISPEHLPHLFERFYRVDAARDRAQGGYGLGLSIAQSIVVAHNGKISVTSTPEAGTTFTVLFSKK